MEAPHSSYVSVLLAPILYYSALGLATDDPSVEDGVSLYARHLGNTISGQVRSVRLRGGLLRVVVCRSC